MIDADFEEFFMPIGLLPKFQKLPFEKFECSAMSERLLPRRIFELQKTTALAELLTLF